MNYREFKELLIEFEEINDNHFFRDVPITKLPDNLTIEESLNLSDTPITELPDSLRVKDKVIKSYEINKMEEGYNENQRYIFYDGILWGNVTKVKKLNEETTIYKTPLGFCIVEKELAAHGKTLREAMSDLKYKKIENLEKDEIIDEIIKAGKVTKEQYRAITGACQMGVENFCKRHNLTGTEIDLEELRKILVNNYGAVEFWNAIDNKDNL